VNLETGYKADLNDHRLTVNAMCSISTVTTPRSEPSFQSDPSNPDASPTTPQCHERAQLWPGERPRVARGRSGSRSRDLGLSAKPISRISCSRGGPARPSPPFPAELPNAPHWQAGGDVTYRDPRGPSGGPFAIDAIRHGRHYFDLPPNFHDLETYGLLHAKNRLGARDGPPICRDRILNKLDGYPVRGFLVVGDDAAELPNELLHPLGDPRLPWVASVRSSFGRAHR